MKFKDGKTYDFTDSSTALDCVAVVKTFAELDAIRAEFTEDNLKGATFDGAGWQCTADTVQPMYINNLCIIVGSNGKVYLGEWSASQGAVQFIAVPNGGRMSMDIGY